MSDENQEPQDGQPAAGGESPEITDAALKQSIQEIKVSELADEVKAGDDAINKLKVQNLDFILDIPLKVSVELGRTNVVIKDLLQLGQGSVLELDKLAGEPLEVLVNGKLVARGEVVVVNEKFGIRLTDIISPIERIETLK
jgi:flagellar motor switch protein FliN/FliY